MQKNRLMSIKAFIISALFLSACGGATAVPTSTSPTTAPVSTEVATAASTTEATGTTEATSEATGTTEAGGTETPSATVEMTGTVEATGTVEMTGTVQATGTAEATSTSVVTGTAEAMGGDIVETAMASAQFSTLVRALNAAGLVDQLKQQGPFTVFVPSDQAFSKMSADSLTSLLADKQRLTNILTYHVVPGKLTAADLANVTSVKTLNGAELTVKVTDGVVYLNDAKVVQSDIAASNGVIHVIDTVLTPPTQ